MAAVLVAAGYAGSMAQANETFPFVGEITANRVHVRAGQAEAFDSLGLLNEKDPVVVLSKSYSWYQIKLPLQAQCYVSQELLEVLRDDVAQIKGNRVNVRARPNIQSSIIGQLAKGTRVKILSRLEDGWCQIEPVEGLSGWVVADLVAFKSLQIPAPRVVELPTRNIYVQKQQEEAARQAQAQEEQKAFEERKQEALTVRGAVRVLASPAPIDGVAHTLTGDDGGVYYLKGYRNVLDGFVNLRVQVRGITQETPGSDQPVLLVTQVNLIL